MKKNNTFYSFQRILYNEKDCICWAFHEPLHHEEPVYSSGYACWCEPGTYVRIRPIDGAVRHMALRLATDNYLVTGVGNDFLPCPQRRATGQILKP